MMSHDPFTADWLLRNREHRMDALDSSGIFPPERQAFHMARYEFALRYVVARDVADIACGLGYGCRILKEGGASSVVGVDVSSEAIQYARSVHQVPGVRFEISDACSATLESGSIDVITSFETIEHVPATDRLLAEFGRVLRPNGTLIVSTPNDWGLTQHHCHTWTVFEFVAEINGQFTIESIWEQNSREPLISSIKPWHGRTPEGGGWCIVVARKLGV